MAEIQQKCSEYLRLGVPYIFIVDPRSRAVLIASARGFLALEHKVTFECKGREVSIAFADLFEASSAK